MKSSVPIGCLLLLAGTVVIRAQNAGSETRMADIVKELLETMDKLTMQLEAIKDEDTAKASKDELRKSVSYWLEVRKKAEKMKPPSKEEKDRLEKEYKSKLQAAQKKLFGEIARVKSVPGGPDALKEIRGLLGKNPK
jgi:hypothetical protein